MNQKINGAFAANGKPGSDDMSEPESSDLKKLEIEIDEREIEQEIVSTERLTGFELYMRPFSNCKVLPPGNVVTLVEKMHLGDMDAREKLIKHNFGLILFIGRRYKGLGLDDQDIYQEGSIGLMKGIDKFDPSKGYKLSTYIWWWIRQSITRAIADKAKEIRVPVNKQGVRYKINKIATRLMAELGRKPTIQEIAECSGCDIESIADAFSMSGKVVFSIDEPLIHDDGESSWQDILPDSRNIDPRAALIAKEGLMHFDDRIRALCNVLSTLGVEAKYVEVFKSYYCINDSSVRIYTTLEHVASKFHLTRERIRQIVAFVRSKLEKRDPEWGSVLEALGVIDDKHSGANTFDLKKYEQRKADKSKYRKKSFTHFRASPAFVHWEPSDAERNVPAQAIIVFVSAAYEIETAEVLAGIKDVAKWAKRVSIYLMVRVLGLDYRLICCSFSGMLPSSIEEIVVLIDDVLKNDALVSQDVEGMMSHLSKAMGKA